MKFPILILLLLPALAFPQEYKMPKISVSELPPEAIPTGTCTQSNAGYLGIVQKDKTERTTLTDREIGEYIRKKLAEGYSVMLYPQASGKIFTFQTCHSAKP